MKYRWLVLVMLVLSLVTPAAVGSGRARQTEMRADEIAKEYVDAYNAHDVARLAALYADNVKITTPDLSTVTGRDEQKKYFTAWFASVPDVKNTIRSLVVETDQFVLELNETGTYSVRLPSVGSPPARGQKLAYPYVIIATVKDGKMSAVRIYENDLLIERQLKIRS